MALLGAAFLGDCATVSQIMVAPRASIKKILNMLQLQLWIKKFNAAKIAG
jgi:hypothetical protein